MFNFKPVSEEEALGLLPVGEYDFSVKHAENATSKKGNPMIKLLLEIYDTHGKSRLITDYLMEALAYKLRHFCYATGLESKYEAGSFDAADCIGKSGKCKIKIEESDGYAPKNAAQDYIKSDGVTKKNDDFIDSELPF